MLQSSRILVVDDDSKVRDLIREVLWEEGHKISEAGDGEEALAVVLKERPHIVVCDIVMPKVDGMEFCRRLRKRRSTRYLPFIFLTNEARVSDIIEGFDAGADEYLPKPFTPRELSVRVEQVLNRSFFKLDPVTRLPGYYITECELTRAFRDHSKYEILVIGAVPGGVVEHPGIGELLGLIGEGAWKTLSQLDEDGFLGRYDLFRFVGITEKNNQETFERNLRKTYDRISSIAMRGVHKDQLPKLKICKLQIKDGSSFGIYQFRQWIDYEYK